MIGVGHQPCMHARGFSSTSGHAHCQPFEICVDGLSILAMIGASDQPCWLVKACKVFSSSMIAVLVAA